MESSDSSSNLSLNLKYPFFKLKFSCDDGEILPKKEKKPILTKPESLDDQSISSQEIPWLSKNKQFCKIAFDEKLTVFKTLDKMVGEAVINVYLTSEYDLSVHCNWKLFDTKCFNGNMFDTISFTSLVTRSLITLEEKYCEVDIRNHRENHLYLCEKMDSYHVTQSSVENTHILSQRFKDYCLKDYKDILTHGSLILLLRQMTLLNIQYIDPLHFIMPDGSVSKVKFNMEDFQCVVFDGNLKILVKKITTTITHSDTDEILEEIVSLLSENGRIVYQEWKKKEIVLRFDPRKSVTLDYCSHQPFLANPTTEIPLDKVWRQDLQLNTMYTQQNKALQREYETFYESNQELRSILRDYMKDVLMFKPKDPVKHTVNYFNHLLF